MANKKVPELRFKGFTDDWELCKFTDLVNRVSKTSNSNMLPKVEFEDIIAGEGRLNKDVTNKLDDRKGILFEPNSILYGKLRPYLKNWLFTDFRGIALGDFWVFEAKNSDIKFSYYLIQAEKYQKVANDTSGTKMPRSDWKQVSNTTFLIPGEVEQSKVGFFLSTIDNTIDLHQRKIDVLVQLKQGFLQQMFPIENERVPQLRFTNFNSDWEQRKVVEIFKVTRGKVLAITETSEKPTEEMPYPVYSSQTKNDGLMGYYDEYLFEKAITWTTDGANAGTVNYRHGKFYSTNVNGVLLSKEGYANKAISEALNKVAWKYVSHVGNPKLMNNVMSKITISIPTSMEEQIKISSILNYLDKLIALHQQKLDSLNKIKRAFLQKMFI